MKKILPVLLLLIMGSRAFAQRFSQYFTNTLYDSFENPSQKTFVADSSRQFAFNFFMPNGGLNLTFKGDAQVALKQRFFSGRSKDPYLVIDPHHYNMFNADANMYYIMLKVFSSFSGDQEIGFSAQVRAQSRLYFTDATAAITNGLTDFKGSTYANIFNDQGYLQTYHQFSFTYREQVNRDLSVGVKLSALSGIAYADASVFSSAIDLDKASDQGYATLAGYYRNTTENMAERDYFPTFKNPGASISLSSTYTTQNKIQLQFNLKDLGFIHWSSSSRTYVFNSSSFLNNLSGPGRLDSIRSGLNRLVTGTSTQYSFTTPTDARLEFAATKTFGIDYDNQFKYSPAFIASKELYFPGFDAALVNRFQYKNLSVSLTPAYDYDNVSIVRLGAQFMVKSPNAEFFIGSDQLVQSVMLVSAAGKNQAAINQNAAFAGANFYIGFSLKFGHIIERPMNASYIPMGEEGPLGKLWDKLFHKTPEGEL